MKLVVKRKQERERGPIHSVLFFVLFSFFCIPHTYLLGVLGVVVCSKMHPYPTPEPTPRLPPELKDDALDMINMTTTTKTFHQFPLLPPELRNIIWDLALPAPVVYDIYPASSTQTTPPEQGLRFVHPFSEPPPALAAVCRESRSLALHRYRPLTLDGTTKYVDLRQDILLLESSLYKMHLFRTLHFMGKIPLIRENLRSLAFGTSYGVYTGLCHPVLGWQNLTRNNIGRFLQRLTALRRLEKLIFVIHQEAQFAVPELPPASDEDEYARDGQVVLNATLYSKKSSAPPPRPRVLAGREIAVVMEEGQARLTAADLSSSKASPGDPAPAPAKEEQDDHFRRVPWTGQKPMVPHVNEFYYYPIDDAAVGAARQAKPSSAGKNNSTTRRPVLARRGAVPADEDWQQFKKTIKRDLDTGLRLGLAEKTVKTRASRQGQKRKQQHTTAGGAAEEEEDGPQSKRACTSSTTTTVSSSSKQTTTLSRSREGSCTASNSSNTGGGSRWTIEGASLLWRYTMPSLPGF